MFAIKSIFTGMLLILLNFNIDIGAARIGLIPSFLGYILISKGLTELCGFSERFSKMIPYAKGMAIYCGILYAADLFGLSSQVAPPLVLFLGLISMVIYLYISYYIVLGVRDIEIIKEQSLNFTQLYSIWKLRAVLSSLTYLFTNLVPALAVILIIINFIVEIYFLDKFHKTKVLFYAQNPVTHI